MGRRIDVDILGIAVAGLLVAVALAILAVPGAESVLPSPVQALDDVFPADAVAVLLALLLAIVACIGLVRRRPGRSEEDPRNGAGAGTADGGVNRRRDRAGGDVGGRTGTAGRESPGLVGQRTTERYEQVVEQLRSQSGCPEPEPPTVLRDVAIDLEQSRGHDAATARDRVHRGAWTSDPVAAAFLGDTEAGELSLRQRLYGAVYPARAYERRFERTLRTLEAVAAEALDGSTGTADPGATARDRQEPETESDGDGAADASEPTRNEATGERGADGVA